MNAAYRRSAATTEKADQSDKAEKDGTRLRNSEQLEVVPDHRSRPTDNRDDASVRDHSGGGASGGYVRRERVICCQFENSNLGGVREASAVADHEIDRLQIEYAWIGPAR